MADINEISITSNGFHLSGTLALPDSNGPFPAALLIPGSGQVDRDENHKKLRINAFLEITDFLILHGIATLRYDKRGVGNSSGNFWNTGLFDNVQDAAASLQYLRNHPRIDPDRVFLLGHSEGALIAIRLAANGFKVAGIILLSCPAQKGEDVLKWQAQQIVKGLRGPNKWIMRLLRIDVSKSQQKQIDKIRRSSEACIRIKLIAKINARWMREFMDYDPAEDLRKIKVPVLAITGTKDIQVNPADLKRMAELIKVDFTFHELQDVTHILRVEEGEPTLSTYKKQTHEKMDPRILLLLIEWLQTQLCVEKTKD